MDQTVQVVMSLNVSQSLGEQGKYLKQLILKVSLILLMYYSHKENSPVMFSAPFSFDGKIILLVLILLILIGEV